MGFEKMVKAAEARKKRFGDPPAPEVSLGNLSAPEVAPSAEGSVSAFRVSSLKGEEVDVLPWGAPPVDLRTLRATGRTARFSTTVQELFKQKFAEVAKAEGISFNELLERCFALYLKK